MVSLRESTKSSSEQFLSDFEMTSSRISIRNSDQGLFQTHSRLIQEGTPWGYDKESDQKALQTTFRPLKELSIDLERNS